MKNAKWLLSLLLGTATLTTFFVACSSDDEDAPPLSIVSIKADDVDLNGIISATGVPVGATIVATFNVPVDEASAEDFITLIREYDNTPYEFDLTVDGNEVTIDPVTDFSTGTLFVLTFETGMKSAAGSVTSIALERNFTTEGTFAVPGAIAHWTFEDNAVDIIAGKAPTASGVVAVTYVDGRSADAGKAASFNGTTSIIEFANGSALMNNGSWTMSIWVKPNSSLEKGQFVLGLGAFYGFQMEIFGSYNGFKLAAAYAHTNPAGPGKFTEDLWADGEGNLGWQGWTFSKDFTPTGGMNTVIKDKWAHYVFVYNATDKTGTVYLNGEKIKEQDFDNWPDGDNKRFATGLSYRGTAPEVVDELALGFIQSRAGELWDAEPWGGYDNATANHFHGLMDDLIIYHKALSASEVALMYNSSKP